MVANTAYYFSHELSDDVSLEVVIAAAWAHDLIEDAQVSYNDVKINIGQEAADIAYDVTDELGKNRRERSLMTLPKIAKNPLAIYVKLADRISNTTYSKENGTPMYKMYKKEYPFFRASLKLKRGYGDKYPEMWAWLDKLNEFEAV